MHTTRLCLSLAVVCNCYHILTLIHLL